MQQNERPDLPEPSHFAPKLYGIAAIVCVMILVGLWLVSRYIALDVARDMRTWNEKINLITESRAADVTKYVRAHFKEIHGLSDNPSLQLYLTELQMLSEGDARPVPPAQLEYLRNLLTFSAQRGGYMPETGSAKILANIEPAHKSGLAVLNTKNEVVVSTPMPEQIKEIIIENAQKMMTSEDALIDLRKDDDGTIYMGFLSPVFSIQGEKNTESQVGTVVAIKEVGVGFFDLLKHPGVTEKTLEVMLVRENDGNIEFLTPLLDKSAALTKQIDKATYKFVEARLLQTPGNFISDMKDYAKKKVLATSRKIAGTPWTMIVKVEAREALNASTQRRNNMIIVFVLALVIIVLTMIAIWWNATSKRALLLSHHFRRLADQSRAQEKLLRLVSDNQPEAIFILDREHRYQFANLQAVVSVGMSPESVVGKDVRDVRGTARAEHIIAHCQDADQQGKIAYHTFQHDEHGTPRTFRSAYVPVEHVPVIGLPQPTPGVLVVEQDITEVVEEREKRLLLKQDLINTLVTLVDRRDPFAANHSLMVSGLAQHIAVQLGLDHVMVETAQIAGSLMNIGKIVISTKLLTKTEALTDEERRIIRDSMVDAAELIKQIHFDGPVYDTLRQWQEKWDGTGALGLQGDAILISARILAVANTFIGMISPRSWRTAISSDNAIKFLMDNCGVVFDRRVVVALVHFIENQHGKEWLAAMVEARDAA